MEKSFKMANKNGKSDNSVEEVFKAWCPKFPQCFAITSQDAPSLVNANRQLYVVSVTNTCHSHISLAKKAERQIIRVNCSCMRMPNVIALLLLIA